MLFVTLLHAVLQRKLLLMQFGMLKILVAVYVLVRRLSFVWMRDTEAV